MIVGVGCDIVEIKRVMEVANPEKFASRILSASELEVYETMTEKGKINFLVGRFAAKEAFAKAMGYGIGAKLSLQDISVLNHKSGAPYIVCSALPQCQSCYISIAHERHYAIAYCVISGS